MQVGENCILISGSEVEPTLRVSRSATLCRVVFDLIGESGSFEARIARVAVRVSSLCVAANCCDCHAPVWADRSGCVGDVMVLPVLLVELFAQSSHDLRPDGDPEGDHRLER